VCIQLFAWKPKYLNQNPNYTAIDMKLSPEFKGALVGGVVAGTLQLASVNSFELRGSSVVSNLVANVYYRGLADNCSVATDCTSCFVTSCENNLCVESSEYVPSFTTCEKEPGELESGICVAGVCKKNLPWWFYLLMPFVSAFVGWWTNKVALQLTFYPLKFVGINIKRWEDQPIGLIGWQGIVPTKARKMASDSVDLMTAKLFNIKEIFGRIDKQEAAKHLKTGFGDTVGKMIDDISARYIIDKNTQWKRTESTVKAQITQWALNELPAFTNGFMGDLVDNLDNVYDLKYMCVTEMVNNPQLLVDVFMSVGAKELRFIEMSGGYFGFIFGAIQTVLFRWVIPPPLSDYMLPPLGFVVGFLTNYIALYMIFKPINPVRFCGGRIVAHGLFLKRQKEASSMFATKMVTSVLHSENIWKYMMTGPLAHEFEALLRKHTTEFTERMIGYSKPLVLMYVGAENFEKMKKDTADLTVNEIHNIIQFMHEYTDEALDLETEIRTKMQALPSDEFERVLHPVFEEDELKLILVGAFLGIAVGAIQMGVSFALQA